MARILGQLPRSVSLHDIRDVDAWIAATIRKLALPLTDSEREELECEGYAILWQLEAAWDGEGPFSAYITRRLRYRLINALHGMRDIRPRGPDGSRPWLPRPEVSLEAELARPGFRELGLRRLNDFTRVRAGDLVAA